MALEILQTTSMLAATLSALAAVFSGTCAFLSYRLARKMQNELKSDETIIPGIPVHPSLREEAHSACMIECIVFNKSKRKAFINKVSVVDRKGKPIEVTWSAEIDGLGNALNRGRLVGLIDMATIYVRKNDGERIDYACIHISHSFSSDPLFVIFDPAGEWVAAAERDNHRTEETG